MILLFVAMPVTSTLYLILEEEGSALGVAVDFLAMVIVAALLLFVIPLPPACIGMGRLYSVVDGRAEEQRRGILAKYGLMKAPGMRL